MLIDPQHLRPGDNAMMDRQTRDAILSELTYATRQLRKFQDIGRALDALDRALATVKDADWLADETVELVE
jgi:hypothetical protein